MIMNELDFAFISDLRDRKRFSGEEKAALEKYAAKYGIRLNKGCGQCWRDLVIQLHAIYKREQAIANGGRVITPKGYELKAGTDFFMIVGGRTYHICPKNLTDKSAELWLSRGLSKTHFAALPQSESEKAETVEDKEQANEDN